MGARATPSKGCTTGNFVSEWFGHQVWPQVSRADAAMKDQCDRACPFLTVTTGQPAECVKRTNGWDEPYGVCTISSDSNGIRQEWIACPYRTLDQHFTLLSNAVRAAYGVPQQTTLVLLPITVLNSPRQRQLIAQSFVLGRKVFLFAAQKLGGEIDLPETDSSPGASVDVSVIEIVKAAADGKPTEFGKHLFYEIQTSDFHGSPLHAAALLKELCLKGRPCAEYHQRLAEAVEICGTGVEGPNKANIFKRTIYQMILKIELARHSDCAGFAIVLPVPVWDSWLRHLGQPLLERVGATDEHVVLLAPAEDPSRAAREATAHVYVFDIDDKSAESPRPLKIVKKVACSAEALIHHTFVTAAEKAKQKAVIDAFRKSMIRRIKKAWQSSLPASVQPELPLRGSS